MCRFYWNYHGEKSSEALQEDRQPLKQKSLIGGGCDMRPKSSINWVADSLIGRSVSSATGWNMKEVEKSTYFETFFAAANSAGAPAVAAVWWMYESASVDVTVMSHMSRPSRPASESRWSHQAFWLLGILMSFIRCTFRFIESVVAIAVMRFYLSSVSHVTWLFVCTPCLTAKHDK